MASKNLKNFNLNQFFLQNVELHKNKELTDIQVDVCKQNCNFKIDLTLFYSII